MKVTVTKTFFDKEKKVIVDKDKVIEVSDNRAKELIAAGYVKEAEEEKKEKETTNK